MELKAIWAESSNGVIGKDQDIPWRVPEDFKHFRETTMGGSMLMGRRTFNSLPKLLDGREHIVLTRSLKSLENVLIVNSVEQALSLERDLLWVIGGGEVYKAFLPYLSEVIVTEVETIIEGDGLVHAPVLSGFKQEFVSEWRESVSGLKWRVKRFSP